MINEQPFFFIHGFAVGYRGSLPDSRPYNVIWPYSAKEWRFYRLVKVTQFRVHMRTIHNRFIRGSYSFEGTFLDPSYLVDLRTKQLDVLNHTLRWDWLHKLWRVVLFACSSFWRHHPPFSREQEGWYGVIPPKMLLECLWSGLYPLCGLIL
jgi:hypothetical protein